MNSTALANVIMLIPLRFWNVLVDRPYTMVITPDRIRMMPNALTRISDAASGHTTRQRPTRNTKTPLKMFLNIYLRIYCLQTFHKVKTCRGKIQQETLYARSQTPPFNCSRRPIPCVDGSKNSLNALVVPITCVNGSKNSLKRSRRPVPCVDGSKNGLKRSCRPITWDNGDSGSTRHKMRNGSVRQNRRWWIIA